MCITGSPAKCDPKTCPTPQEFSWGGVVFRGSPHFSETILRVDEKRVRRILESLKSNQL
jgi:hypothetical protein